MDIKISIIDDEPEIRAAVALLLKSVGHKVQCFESAQHYWDNYDPEQAGCLILDIRMPGMGGLELQSKLNKLDYHPPIIMVSGHGEIPIAVTAIQSGAIDFLQKPFSEQLLLDRVNQALELDTTQRSSFNNLKNIKQCYSKLTTRELEVLNGVIDSKLNKTIAAELNVSVRTIEVHRANMMDKMNVKSLASLMRCIAILEDNNIIKTNL